MLSCSMPFEMCVCRRLFGNCLEVRILHDIDTYNDYYISKRTTTKCEIWSFLSGKESLMMMMMMMTKKKQRNNEDYCKS